MPTSAPANAVRSTSLGSGIAPGQKKPHKALPPLFWYMEMGDWEKAKERAKRHPREVKTWATLRTKSMAADATEKVSGTKRLALHHACFKLRSVPVSSSTSSTTTSNSEDAFVEVCRFILLLIELYPDAAGMRESRHGCLPLHLAAFASCAPRSFSSDEEPAYPPCSPTSNNHPLALSRSSTTPVLFNRSGLNSLPRPTLLAIRSNSESTADTQHTNLTSILAEERFTGNQTMELMPEKNFRRSSTFTSQAASVDFPTPQLSSPRISVSMRSNILISAKREDVAVQVLNALLDGYPKGIRVDSEGGRLPLHTACAGRATPRVVSTLLTAYPAAARHRNKDGFLPLHLAAHWGVSHPNVAITLLKAYPDATLGRNRWERTPLEEALCMAGENGRPHQAALVRALRKHPSYWTRPPAELFASSRGGRQISTNVVDIDETIADTNTTTDNEERRYFNSGHTPLLEQDETDLVDEIQMAPSIGVLSRLTPRNLLRKGQKRNGIVPIDGISSVGTEPNLSLIGADLATLIKSQAWQSVLARLECNPSEATDELTLTTRGGFVASSGLTPLHYACERRPPIEVVHALLEASPEALTTKLMPGGCLPLHVACTWHACSMVVSALLAAEPAAASIPDELGNIPLHSACFSGAMAPIIDSLLRSFPKGALARNNQGSLPMDICKRLRHENRKSIMALLITRKDEVLGSHRRSRSSESATLMATRAMELNERDGPPMTSLQEDGDQQQTDHDEGDDVDLKEPGVGVEISYQDGNEELVWI